MSASVDGLVGARCARGLRGLWTCVVGGVASVLAVPCACAVLCGLSRLLDEVRETERQGQFGRAQPLPIFGEAMVDRDPPTRLMWLAFVVVLPLVV